MTTSAVTGQNLTLSLEGDVLAGAKNVSINWTKGTIDKTSRDDALIGSYLAGRVDVSIEIDALYIYSDVAKKVLLNHVNSGSPATITCIVTTPDSATFTGEALVTSFGISGPDEDVMKTTASLLITDGITVSAS